MHRNGQGRKPKVAVIGAGLAGLSAAYYLREKAEVTIFEASDRLGGRILTSHRPEGEHGAEFLLKSESDIYRLAATHLKLKLTASIREEPGYFLRNRHACGTPTEAAETLLEPAPAGRVIQLFRRVRDERWPKTRLFFDQWLASFVRTDKQAIRFVTMLLAGEACAPINHITTRYALECLSSLANDEWYRIRGGSERLVSALHRQSRANVRLKAQVRKVNAIRGGVQIKWLKNGRHRADIFSAVVAATPQGESLIAKKPHGHFHSYFNVLLEYRVAPQIKDAPGFDLTRGLYTDGALNYLQLTKRSRSSYVLRILIPDARSKLKKWSKQHTVAFCVRHLRQILVDPGRVCVSSVKGWEFGLPCGGRKESFKKVTSRIYLAGDRFGKWPSMDAAVKSGYQAAKTIKRLL